MIGLNFLRDLRRLLNLSIGDGKHDFDAFRRNPIFVGKIVVAATLAPMGLGPQDRTKKLAYLMDLLGQLLSQKNVFKNIGPGF